MTTPCRPFPVLLLLALTVFARNLSASPDDRFERQLKPLLVSRCLPCHSQQKNTSGFSIASSDAVLAGGNKHGRAVVEGHPEASPLVQLLRGQLTPQMPLGGILSDNEIDLIVNWIRDLPPAPTEPEPEPWRWPFQKPLESEPPQVGDSAWVLNPIDRFILSRLEQEGLTPAPPASPRTLARRVYLNLVGMPPSPEEIAEFLQDSSPPAFERLIDRLLDDPRYGERWGRHWLDLVRFGESDGLEGDILLDHAWRYRDWVIRAFNDDLPYDHFVQLQLAGGDEHSRKAWYQPDVQGYVPAGFLRLAPWDLGNLNSKELRQSFLDEVTTTTGSVFLGLTIGCARCHDHKYDPIPTRDYYRLQAFFNAARIPLARNTSGVAPEEITVPFQDEAFQELARSKVEHYRKELEDGAAKRELDQYKEVLLEKLIAQKMARESSAELTTRDLELELERADQQVFSQQERAEYDRLKQALDQTQQRQEQQVLAAYEKELLDKLARAYAEGISDPAARFRELTVEDVHEEARRPSRPSKYFTLEEKVLYAELADRMEVMRRRLHRWGPLALTVRNVTGPPLGPDIPATRILKGGDYRQPQQAVQPGFPSAVTGDRQPAQLEVDRYRQYPTRGRRMTLARWITSPENPLTARVMVNRIWQHHFGRGIVATASDFGRNGERRTHPELLDWLALRFVREGWSIKTMHRLMLASNTYRQSSENPSVTDPDLDPENRLLWRFQRRRLEAEAIRDSVLWISGRLNLKAGGPSVFPPLPDDMAGLKRPIRAGGSMWEPNENEDDARRRSVYIFQRRSLPLPMMSSFDAPVFNESCERRSVTTTPLQALSMMNGRLVNEEAVHLALRVEKEAGENRQAQLDRLFQIALARSPEKEEIERFLSFEGDLTAICRVLLNSNELLFIE